METNQDFKVESGVTNPEPTTGSNIWSIMMKVFTAPTQSYQALKEKPKVLIPLIIIFILTLIITLATQKYAILMQLDLIARARNLPPEILQQIRASATQTSLARMAMGGAIGGAAILLFMFIAAGCAMFTGSVVMGGRAKFKAILSVTLTAGLISSLGGLLTLPLIYLKESLLVSIGFAGLLPGKDFTSIVYTLLYQYNFFMIWNIIVAGIGYAVINEFSRSKGLTISIIVSVVLATVAIAFRLFGLVMAGVKISFF